MSRYTAMTPSAILLKPYAEDVILLLSYLANPTEPRARAARRLLEDTPDGADAIAYHAARLRDHIKEQITPIQFPEGALGKENKL